MKKIILPFILILTLSEPFSAQKINSTSGASSASSQMTAKKVIDNYLTALGGRAKLESLKTIIIENTMSAPNAEVKMTTKKMGNKFNSVQDIMGTKVSQVFDGKRGILEQKGMKTEIPAMTISDLKTKRMLDALNYEASTFTGVTSEQIDGKNYHVLTSAKGRYFFDAATGLLYKSEINGGSNSTVKSYMTVEGIKFPELVEADRKGQTISIKTTKIILNSGVSDADFKTD
ncbi:hypothetical protein ASG31_12480 [Chryseobacterium sp. Leaf404]|uniref:hypothetical protein n=1 Tax=unclassified Chryseobacterium TaxID=2593645 RepID=UPI0006F97432|nr:MULTISPECIES: hypothetical protein [unclassified Chryseobacterium]KQT16327.1 hypothetical protein ASG31_12480 [Chryseobacterium sp. Leaf404]